MSKATRILNEYHIKELILRGNPQYENFYKEELIEFCKISKREIDRLNNIINELEKILKEEVKELYNEENPVLLDETYIKYATERKMAYMYILDKLKELKENNK